MQMKLSFLGATQNVTGSRHFLQANGMGILVDCGLYQERQFRTRNWDQFLIAPNTINAILLTHAHLDHCGLLPKLVKEGFNGRIYCTSATAEIAQIILLDSAKIQEEDAEHKRKRHRRKKRKGKYPEAPLYTIEDAKACFPLFSVVKYRQCINIGNGVEACFYDAGHVLGSAIIKVKVCQNGQERTVLFSGDIGRPDRPIVCDPASFEKTDYVVIESTYGDRIHKNTKDVKNTIADVINSTVKAGGNIIVPSFALERSQEILYYINELLHADKIPTMKVFLDSPMASKITKVFQKHTDLFDDEATEFIRRNDSPFNFPGLQMAGTAKQSKAINGINEPIMVIAGSGMCTGGRIKYHLINNITQSQNTIMFVGYQAVGTLGRQIVDGAKQVRLLGQQYTVRAKVVRVHGFSAHADKNELFKWLDRLKKPPKRVFVVHGESESSHHFRDYLREKTNWNVSVPEYQESAVLD